MFTFTGITRGDTFIRQIESGYLTLHPQVQYCRVAFGLQAFHDACFQRYGIFAPPELANAVDKRKAEYLAGRYCCAVLLDKLAIAARISPGKDRAPCWPAGVSGAIAHSDDQAIALLTRFNDCWPGVDIERFDAETMLKCSQYIVSSQELARLRAGPLALELALLLAFSAKESLYKALYPQVKRFFGFDSASIVAIDADARCFTIALNEDLSPRYRRGYSVAGQYRFDDETLITLVIC